jgi:hypothetical protein
MLTSKLEWPVKLLDEIDDVVIAPREHPSVSLGNGTYMTFGCLEDEQLRGLWVLRRRALHAYNCALGAENQPPTAKGVFEQARDRVSYLSLVFRRYLHMAYPEIKPDALDEIEITEGWIIACRVSPTSQVASEPKHLPKQTPGGLGRADLWDFGDGARPRT